MLQEIRDKTNDIDEIMKEERKDEPMELTTRRDVPQTGRKTLKLGKGFTPRLERIVDCLFYKVLGQKRQGVFKMVSNCTLL